MNERGIKITASFGLAAGALFGMVGSFVPSANLRGLAWGLDAAVLVLASVLLTVHYFRKGSDIMAAGFFIFAIGEGLIISTSGINVEATISSFGGGTGLWATSLFIISFQKTFPLFIRCTGLLAAVLFTVVSVRIFYGDTLHPLTKPLPFYAYPFLAATILGWAWTLLRKNKFFKPETLQEETEKLLSSAEGL